MEVAQMSRRRIDDNGRTITSSMSRADGEYFVEIRIDVDAHSGTQSASTSFRSGSVLLAISAVVSQAESILRLDSGLVSEVMDTLLEDWHNDPLWSRTIATGDTHEAS